MAPTRTHQISREFSVKPSIVFAALITPSHLRQWWSIKNAIVISRVGGIWCATWGESEDAPDYVSSARIKAFEPGKRLVLGDYQYVSPEGGLPFEADFETSFLLDAIGTGTKLTVIQAGFPVESLADEYYAACKTGWTMSLDGLEKFLAGL